MQSSRVSDQELAHILASEFGSLLENTAHFLYGSEAESRAKAAVTQAVRSRYSFWGENSLRAFLLRILSGYEVDNRTARWKHKLRSIWIRQSNSEPSQSALGTEILTGESPYGWMAGQTKPVGLLFLLYYGAGLALDEIAYVLGIETLACALLLRSARNEIGEQSGILAPQPGAGTHVDVLERLAALDPGSIGSPKALDLEDHLRQCPDCRLYARQMERLHDFLKKSARSSWPEGAPVVAAATPGGLQISTGAPSQKLALPSWLKELVPVSGLVILILAVTITVGIFDRNRTTAASDAEQDVSRWMSTTEESPRLVETVDLLPLDHTSHVSDILNRMSDGRKTWSTVWAEVLTMDYGPLGYAGPPKIYANRIWLENGGRSLVLGGTVWSSPDYYSLASTTMFHEGLRLDDVWMIQYGGYTNLAPNPALETLSASRPPLWLGRTVENDYASDLFYPGPDLPVFQADQITNLGSGGLVAGRETVLLLFYAGDGQQILNWIDVKTGWLLRTRSYHLSDARWAVSETTVRLLTAGGNFPSGTFDVFEATAVQWDMAPLPADVPERVEPPDLEKLMAGTGRDFQFAGTQDFPTGFDLARARLTFRWDVLPSAGDERTWFASLYGGNWYLGEVKAGDPWDLSCERSPSGRYVVFMNDLNPDVLRAGQMRVVGLENPNFGFSPQFLGDFGADVAFSPHADILVFSTVQADGRTGVYLMDIETFDQRLLVEVPWVAALDWSSPDEIVVVGNECEIGSLANVSEAPEGGTVFPGWGGCGKMKEWVVEVSTGAITSSEDFINGSNYIEFPLELPGLEGCIYP